MTDERSNTGGNTTVVEKSSAGTVLIGIALLVAVLIGGWYLFARQTAQSNKDNAIAGAAHSVSKAADKVSGSSSN